jgi:formate-dependent nitrite reductase membrane component NrfD
MKHRPVCSSTDLSPPLPKKALLALSAVATLAGVVFLRAAVLLAGVWEPLML